MEVRALNFGYIIRESLGRHDSNTPRIVCAGIITSEVGSAGIPGTNNKSIKEAEGGR